MTNRREFLRGATWAAVPLVAGLPGIAPADGRLASAFHAVLIDDSFPEARAFGANLAARGATVRAMADGDVTSVWQQDIQPAWRRGPVPVAGLTRAPVLFCLEQLAWAQGLRVVFHAEHVVTPSRTVRHAVHRSAGGVLSLEAGELAMRGTRWPELMADVVETHGAQARYRRAGPSCAGLLPDLPPDAELLTSWIIAPA
jgi:hypothetical protein